jgi:HPt (histidine-containing phosphotransfer) domain-containing protein
MRLNYTRLREAGMDDREFTRELVTLLLAEGAKRVESIRLAYLHSERDKVAHEAHSLKGACDNLGAEDLAILCGSVDSSLREHDRPPAPAEIQAIIAEFDLLAIELRRVLESFNV